MLAAVPDSASHAYGTPRPGYSPEAALCEYTPTCPGFMPRAADSGTVARMQLTRMNRWIRGNRGFLLDDSIAAAHRKLRITPAPSMSGNEEEVLCGHRVFRRRHHPCAFLNFSPVPVVNIGELALTSRSTGLEER